MPWSVSPNEVRIEYSPEDIRSIGRGFVWFYVAVLAVAGALAALFRPEALVFVVAFGAFLLLWSRRTLAVQPEPYSLVLTRARVVVTQGDREHRVERAQVAAARVRHLYGKPLTRHVVELSDHAGAELLGESVNGDVVPVLEAGLEELGWPLTGRAREKRA